MVRPCPLLGCGRPREARPILYALFKEVRAVAHVAILLLAPFASGAEHQTLALCRYLGARCRVTLLTNDEFAALLARDPFLREYSAGVEVVALGRAFPTETARSPHDLLTRALAYPRIQLATWRALRRLRPSLVHLVLAPSCFAYAPLFYTLPLPTVLTLAGEMRYARRFYGPIKRATVIHAARRADALVVCSADEMANLRAVAPEAAAKATLLDNFTDVARFAPAEEKESLVTFAARLHPEKGALLFLDAASHVAKQVPTARFALMGRGEQAAAVRERLSRLDLDGRLTCGFQTDLAPLFARSSIFVSCQLYENLGSSSLLEAMASGNAVVATDVGQTWQIVDDEVGARVPPDSGAIASATVRLLADRPRLAALGAAARRRVIERYGPEPYVARLLEIYGQAMG